MEFKLDVQLRFSATKVVSHKKLYNYTKYYYYLSYILIKLRQFIRIQWLDYINIYNNPPLALTQTPISLAFKQHCNHIQRALSTFISLFYHLYIFPNSALLAIVSCMVEIVFICRWTGTQGPSSQNPRPSTLACTGKYWTAGNPTDDKYKQ